MPDLFPALLVTNTCLRQAFRTPRAARRRTAAAHDECYDNERTYRSSRDHREAACACQYKCRE
ncbi:hypothetical protein EPN52_05740 [bacterium]|nr:MAG: hypothetical protein EPN52_05740 [bacterium]